MALPQVYLQLLTDDDREQFITDNQEAFRYGAVEEFGTRDEHFNEEGEIISRETIEKCINEGVAYRIVENGKFVGGVVLKIDEKTKHNHLELLFILPAAHSKGLGQAAWREVEKKYPKTIVWETCTPYFETRNLHFYINKCGFHAVEFFCEHHKDPNEPPNDEPDEGPDLMFRFEKRMRPE